MANILENAESIKKFLDICETGDPLKDFYDEDDLSRALITLIQQVADLKLLSREWKIAFETSNVRAIPELKRRTEELTDGT